jgi:hypothetical protein
MPTKKSADEPIRQPAATGYTPEQEADIVKFYPPPATTPEEEAFIAEVVSLDHRSLHRLGPKSSVRQEIKRLLWNAIISAFERRSISQARLFYQKAEHVYYDDVQIGNRLRYLLGMALGILTGAMLGGTLMLIADRLEPYVDPSLLLPIMVFAGLGSVASVLSRLSSIDLRQEPSHAMIILSGATKPIIAIIFAIVVFLILDLKVLDIQFGSATGSKSKGVYLVSSFLCGFSERFGTDLIARISFGGEKREKRGHRR